MFCRMQRISRLDSQGKLCSMELVLEVLYHFKSCFLPIFFSKNEVFNPLSVFNEGNLEEHKESLFSTKENKFHAGRGQLRVTEIQTVTNTLRSCNVMLKCENS